MQPNWTLGGNKRKRKRKVALLLVLQECSDYAYSFLLDSFIDVSRSSHYYD